MRLGRLCQSAVDWFSDVLERRSPIFLALFGLVYLVVTLFRARMRAMWFDEFFTYYLSRLPTMAEVWSALAAAADLNPPLSYAIARAGHAVFGRQEAVDRLPALVGFGLMTLSLFAFVRRRRPAASAAAAMLLPAVTGAYRYAYEARPYGLLLGFGGLAMLCWQRAADGRHRTLALVGLSASLAAAVSCHYFGVLFFLPLAVGETLRLASRKRLDWTLYGSVAAGAAPLLLYLPLMRAASAFSAHSWSRPSFTLVLDFYRGLLSPTSIALAAALCLAAAAEIGLPHPQQPPPASQSPPVHEWGAALTLALLPFPLLIVSKLVTNLFADRYAIGAVIGIAILLGFLVAGRRPAAVLALIFLAAFLVPAARQAPRFRWQVDHSMADDPLLTLAGRSDLPIVFSDGHAFLHATYYGPPLLRPRMVYLCDTEAALRLAGFDTLEYGLPALRRWAPIRAEPYRAFLARYPEFFLHDSPPNVYEWVVRQLVQDGARLVLLAQEENRRLYRVSLTPSARQHP